MYSMKVVVSWVFHTMISPHNGKIFTIGQMTYHNPKNQLFLEKVVSSLDEIQLVTSHSDINPGIYKTRKYLVCIMGLPLKLPSQVHLMVSTSHQHVGTSMQPSVGLLIPTSSMPKLTRNHQQYYPFG